MRQADPRRQIALIIFRKSRRHLHGISLDVARTRASYPLSAYVSPPVTVDLDDQPSVQQQPAPPPPLPE